jgi:hypothetical protein
VRSNGAPDAEYALFEPQDIELRSTGPGNVREHSYRTTAGDARERLAAMGYTAETARACANVMQPKLTAAYARGAAAERLSSKLSAKEVAEGYEYSAETNEYSSMYIDLVGLSQDLGLAHASTSLQCMHLANILSDVPSDTEVELTTIAYMMHRPQGQRSHKRVLVDDANELLVKLREVAAMPAVSRAIPVSQAELVEMLEARAGSTTNESVKARFQELLRSGATAKAPAKGPLADAALWAIEIALNDGHTAGLLEQIDTIERLRGRGPGTAYLRARLSLALGSEAPQRIAEKVSALALSMTSFTQLELLAAEAWTAAGNITRALPYARDLVDAATLDDETRARAARPKATSPAPPAAVTIDACPAP